MRCPSCGSSYFFPSRARNLLERLWQQLSTRVLYRCRKCEHRLWWDGQEPVGEDDLADDHDLIEEDDLSEDGDDHEELDAADDEPDFEKPPS